MTTKKTSPKESESNEQQIIITPLLQTNDLPRPNNAELYGRNNKGKPLNFTEAPGKTPKQQSWASHIRDSVLRSKTFPGVAKAMAEQWGAYLREEEEK